LEEFREIPAWVGCWWLDRVGSWCSFEYCRDTGREYATGD